MIHLCYCLVSFLKIKYFFSNFKNTLQSYIYPVTIIYINFITMTPEAERFNGWAAMLGFVAAVGAMLLLGKLFLVGFV